jgi:hypothetical protein
LVHIVYLKPIPPKDVDALLYVICDAFEFVLNGVRGNDAVRDRGGMAEEVFGDVDEGVEGAERVSEKLNSFGANSLYFFLAQRQGWLGWHGLGKLRWELRWIDLGIILVVMFKRIGCA